MHIHSTKPNLNILSIFLLLGEFLGHVKNDTKITSFASDSP